MYPTPYPELNAVLRELVESMQAILGESFVAACLQGSFAVGEFDRHSDVDFIDELHSVLKKGQAWKKNNREWTRIKQYWNRGNDHGNQCSCT